MTEETDLHVLARLSNGTPNNEDAFIIRDENDNEIRKIHSLEDLVDALSSLSPEHFFPSLCRMDEDKVESDIAFWIHYVLGDAVLSAKVFNIVKEYYDDLSVMKLQVFNLCFNRYLNFQEVIDFDEDLPVYENDDLPPTDI